MMFLCQYIRKYFFLFAVSFISIIATSMLSMFFVMVVQQVLNDVYAVHISSIFIKFSSILFVISLLVIVRVVSTSYVIAKMVKDIREEMYGKIINLYPYSCLKKKVVDIITTFNSDTVVLETCLSVQYPIFLRNVLGVCGSLIMLFITDTKLFLYITFTIPIIGILIMLLNKKVKLFSDKLRVSVVEFSLYVEEFIARIKLVQSLNYENESIIKVNLLIKNTYQFFLCYSGYRSILITSIIVTVFSVLSFIISTGVYNILNNKISLGDFTAFVMYLIIAVNALSNLGESFSELIQLRSVIERISELINISCKNNPPTVAIGNAFKRIIFENVSFTYPGSNVKCIDNLCLEINFGSKIAIVGSSGAGKSTIFQLILGFYEVSSGKITIDGININDIDKNQLHSLFSWVPQENTLFTGSIKDNIKIGKPYASDDEVIFVSKHAKILEFSDTLPDGLDTIIGETNANLSYGQKQRVSIARAFLRDAPVLLLDEATSALDNMNEKYILESINEIAAYKTVIVITHKLSNLRNVDTIIIMKKGNIVETGTHDELVKREGEYQKMFLFDSEK